MTKLENLIEEKKSLISVIDDSIKKLNEIALGDDLKAFNTVKTGIDENVKKYAGICQQIAFEELSTKGNGVDIMKTAIKQGTYGVIRLVQDKETKVFSIDDTTRKIDLAKLNKYCGGGIGKDRHWVYKCEKLNYLMAIRVSKDVDASAKNQKEIKELYRISDKGMAQVFSKDITSNQLSNKVLCIALQEIIDSMLGEGFKVISCDVNFLIHSYCSNNGMGLKAPNHAKFRNFIASVCYKLLTGDKSEYDIVFPKNSKK